MTEPCPTPVRPRHRDPRAAQGVLRTRRHAGRGRGPGPHGAGGRGARVPRPQRLRQDHHDPDAARPGPRHPGRDGAVRPSGARRAARGHGPGRRGRGVAQVLPQLHRPAEPAPARPLRRRRGRPGRPGGRDRRAHRPRPGALQDLLARHEAAARDRRHAAQGPGPADPRRADQRARPLRHPRGARGDPRPGRRRRDGPAQLAHPGRGAAGLHVGHDPRQRPDAGVGQRRGAARQQYDAAGGRAGRRGGPDGPRGRRPAVTGEDGPALLVETDRPGEVTRVLGEAGVWLTELTPVRADLESIFLEVTEGEQLGGSIAWPVDGPADGGPA